MRPRTKSIILLLLTGFLWSIGGVFIKTSVLHPMVISSIRGGVAALVFLAVLKGRPQFTWSRPQVIGAICYCAVLTCFVVSNTLTTAANAILLQYNSPVIVAFLAYFILHERLHWFDFASVGLVMAGIVLMIQSDSGAGQAGNVLAIVTGCFYGTFVVMMRMQKDGSPYETVLLGNILTCAVGVPFFFVAPPVLVGVPPIVLLGAVQIALPYLLLAYASRHAKAIDVSLLPILEPVLNPVWVYLFTGESPGYRAVIGGCLLLGAVVAKSLVALRVERD
jgi:drug/metabolite transporter (DMT)-like permease